MMDIVLGLMFFIGGCCMVFWVWKNPEADAVLLVIQVPLMAFLVMHGFASFESEPLRCAGVAYLLPAGLCLAWRHHEGNIDWGPQIRRKQKPQNDSPTSLERG